MISVTDAAMYALKGPNQIAGEWKSYLLFLQSYFVKYGIVHPVIVEVGTQQGRQREHYQTFFDAQHFGIDISDKLSKPDIVGNSHDPRTISHLKAMLGNFPINVLFLDGAHTYLDTSSDYYAYGPLVKDIIAFHDIRHEKEIGQLWKDIQEAEKENKDLTFLSIGNHGNGWCELGIGLIVKRSPEDLGEIKNG